MPYFNATPNRFELWGATVVLLVSFLAVSLTNRNHDAENVRLTAQVVGILERMDSKLGKIEVNQTVNVAHPPTHEEMIRDITIERERRKEQGK